MCISSSVARTWSSSPWTPLHATPREEGVRRLLVVSRDGRLAGIVTLDDLIDTLCSELGDLAQALRAGTLHERSVVAPVPGSETKDQLKIPQEALAQRWRQISKP